MTRTIELLNQADHENDERRKRYFRSSSLPYAECLENLPKEQAYRRDRVMLRLIQLDNKARYARLLLKAKEL